MPEADLHYTIIGIISGILSISAAFLYYKWNSNSSKKTPDIVFVKTNGAIPQTTADDDFIGKMKHGSKNIVIFYGSQTGTAEDFAGRLSKQAIRFGMKGMAADPESYDMENLTRMDEVENSVAIFCMATYGEGDPTDNAQEFKNWLETSDGVDLNGLRYTVFALGNKTYENFNEMGKYVDKRLEEMGGKRVYGLGMGDDDGNIEEDFLTWQENLYPSICEELGLSGEEVEVRMREFRLITDQTILPEKMFSGEMTRLGSYRIQRPPFDQKNPFLSKITMRRELHQPASDRSCMHIEIDITGSNLRYDCGDHIAVLPSNDAQLVKALADRLNIDLDDMVNFVAIDSDNSKKYPFPCPCTYRTALTHYVDITMSPRTNVLKEMAEYTDKTEDKEFLKKLASTDGKDEYQTWIVDDRRHILAVLEDIPSIAPFPDHLMELLPRLQPRYYSISSSPKINKNVLSITAVLVDYTSKTNRHMRGVATGYLHDNTPTESIEDSTLAPKIPVYIRRSQFRMPYKHTTGIIMIGPGTGLAPFRGFIQERTLIKQQGKPVGEMVLFFGCRRRDIDYIYEEELTQAEQDGVLTKLHVAFSREQNDKVYVQHLMLRQEIRTELWRMIKSGAHFYICGDAKNMAKDVNHALETIFQTEGEMTEETAHNYLKNMMNKGRYSTDVWS